MNTINLRQMTLLDILDRTFRIYRENFLQMVIFVAAVIVPVAIIQNILAEVGAGSYGLNYYSSSAQTLSALNTACFFSGISLLLSMIQAALVNGVIVYMASETLLGRRVSTSEAFSAVRDRLTNVGCGFALFGFVIGAFFVAVGALTVCIGVFSYAFLGFVAYIGIAAYALLAPVLVLEDIPTSRGINRAYELGKDRFWKVFAVIVVLALVGFLLSLAFSALGGLIVGFAVGTAQYQTLSIIITTIITVFLAPLTPIAGTLLYYDVRVRLEALDIELQALDIPNARPSDLTSPLSNITFTSKDLTNVVILLVSTLAIGLAFAGAMSRIINAIMPGLNLGR